jgi:ATP-dependent helicase YprA (DUF1998 family)
VTRNLSLLLVICIELKGKYNVVIPATERKVAIVENIQNQGNHRRSDICKRCGRKLKAPESVEIGFGAICFKKFMAESLLKPLFEVKQREVNETEKTK